MKGNLHLIGGPEDLVVIEVNFATIDRYLKLFTTKANCYVNIITK